MFTMFVFSNFHSALCSISASFMKSRSGCWEEQSVLYISVKWTCRRDLGIFACLWSKTNSTQMTFEWPICFWIFDDKGEGGVNQLWVLMMMAKGKVRHMTFKRLIENLVKLRFYFLLDILPPPCPRVVWSFSPCPQLSLGCWSPDWPCWRRQRWQQGKTSLLPVYVVQGLQLNGGGGLPGSKVVTYPGWDGSMEQKLGEQRRGSYGSDIPKIMRAISRR